MDTFISLLLTFVFIDFNLVIFLLLKKRKKATDITLFCIGVYFLIYKTVEYIYWQAVGLHFKVPMEFSALSYFIFGIAVVTKWKPLLNIASFYAPIAGLMYYITIIFTPSNYIYNNDGTFLLVMAIINHGLLYFTGMLLLSTRKIDKGYFWQVPLAVALSIGWCYLMVFVTKTPETVIFIDIAEGRVLASVVSEATQNSTWFKILYQIVLYPLLFALIWVIYFFNSKVVNPKRVKSPQIKEKSDTPE